ncbi:MAG TPA: NUDIX domain-containing protein [Caulobacteraceae bacterium]|nr:NUDIX domain-containing protein [Caulobacteraceae bacterium]
MSAPISAALLVWRVGDGGPEFLLVHPGGPYWARKDAGAWSIPKGLVDVGEDARAAALREFAEETGLAISGEPIPLADARQRSRKIVRPFLIEADLDLAGFRSNTFELEWPPRSGRRAAFPEADRAAYFPLTEALEKIVPGQAPIIREAAERIG